MKGGREMTNRKRDKTIYFFVNEAERDEIYEKMKLLGTSNLSAYMRKMAIDGYVIEVDHSDIREAGEKIKKIGQQNCFAFARFDIANALRCCYNEIAGMFPETRVSEAHNTMISYKKLWHILLDKDLKKKDLVRLAGVSTYTVNKLTHGDNVTTDVLLRICKALEVDIGDIMEIVPDAQKGDVSR
jgi:DNA-binding Xre family transcriptional regulator